MQPVEAAQDILAEPVWRLSSSVHATFSMEGHCALDSCLCLCVCLSWLFSVKQNFLLGNPRFMFYVICWSWVVGFVVVSVPEESAQKSPHSQPLRVLQGTRSFSIIVCKVRVKELIAERGTSALFIERISFVVELLSYSIVASFVVRNVSFGGFDLEEHQRLTLHPDFPSFCTFWLIPTMDVHIPVNYPEVLEARRQFHLTCDLAEVLR